MTFRILARTILHLGSELIGSDAIAFYELIKNAFDARSPDIHVDVLVRLSPDAYRKHFEAIRAAQSLPGEQQLTLLPSLKSAVLADIIAGTPADASLREELDAAVSLDELLRVVDGANRIDFVDSGDGMTFEDLEQKFMTIGTRSRLEDAEHSNDDRLILGEKGLGRLSAMRLGWRMHVRTATLHDQSWNILDIDWRAFSHDSDAELDDIELGPTHGPLKGSQDPAKGTRIRISGLRSPWSEEKLRSVATAEFSRLTDPFQAGPRYPILLTFNDAAIGIPALDRILFDAAHATITAQYVVDDAGPHLSGKIDYLLRSRSKGISVELPDLRSITGFGTEILRSLGPFQVRAHWFNRQILHEVEGIGDRRKVLELVNRWAGGLMVFRDGFRVNPYGGQDDDWLDLDRKALASSGYKVSRRQIIGKVDISRDRNPELLDQTNREGLRDSEQRQALVAILKHIIETEFRAFLNAVDQEKRAILPSNFDDLTERFGRESTSIRSSISSLTQKHPEMEKSEPLLGELRASLATLEQLLGDATELAASFERGREQLVNLAGLGLMVEILAHELNRATSHALETLAGVGDVSVPIASKLGTLRSQLTTLQKRLRVIDPLSNAGRQVKEAFDLVAWVKEIMATHEAQFRRHNIATKIEVSPSATSTFPVKMVKGMVVQIIENLISNSVYWLKLETKSNRAFRPEFSIAINVGERVIVVSDNGPGVSTKKREEIFEPFVTSKPPGQGKGLGLFVSREIARYHGAELFLAEEPRNEHGRLAHFKLVLPASR